MAPKTMPATRKLRNSVTARRAFASWQPKGGPSGDRPSAPLRRRPYHLGVAVFSQEAVGAAVEPYVRRGRHALDLAILHLGEQEAPRRNGLGGVTRGDEPSGIEERDVVQCLD